MPYALLQKSLEQTIDRRTLEEASVHAPSVARADCARLSRQLFGILVTGLPYEEAAAFQTALAHYGFPTEIVSQQELPALTPPLFRRGIRFHPGSFTDIDGLGRESVHPWDEVQFAAGGFVQRVKPGQENRLEWNYSHGTTTRAGSRSVQLTRTETEVKEREFRLELFLSCAPFRLQFRAQEESLFRYDGAVLRLRQPEPFVGLLRRLASMLPPDCLGLGILAAARGESFCYPGAAALEEEITWHLYQRLRR